MSKSDAEWYFWQSHESKIYYYMFFTLLKHDRNIFSDRSLLSAVISMV